MNNKNVITTTTEATNNTTEATVMQDDELMKMKLAYAQFSAESHKNRTFGEKVLDSLPYLVSGLALGASGLALGASIKALDTAKKVKVSEETRAIPTTWTPSPDGDLE